MSFFSDFEETYIDLNRFILHCLTYYIEFFFFENLTYLQNLVFQTEQFLYTSLALAICEPKKS